MKRFKALSAAQVSGMAILSALSVVLAIFVHIPIFPAVSFLEYDPADIPIFLGTFLYGPLAGLIMTVVVSVIQGTTVSAQSGFIGIVMHIFATGTFVLIAGNIYKRNKTFKGALLSIGAGIVGWIVGMTLWNIILTPIFMNAPRAVVINLLGFIVAFNVIKVVGNSLLTILLYKRLRYLFDFLFQTGKYARNGANDEDFSLTACEKFAINTDSLYNQEVMKEYVTNSVKETYHLAAELARTLRGGEIILLSGDLGAGKTTFTKGLFEALGVRDIVTSPTFTIMKAYNGRFPLYHFDMYRLGDEAEAGELGLQEYLYDGGISVIEWNKFTELPRNRILIEIERLGDEARRFRIRGEQ